MLVLIHLAGCQKPKIVKTVEIKYDTVRTTKFDTLQVFNEGGEKVITIVRKDTFYITKTNTQTIYEKCNDRTERIIARLDYKAERDSFATILKLERENTKQKKHTGQQAVKEKRIENRGWFWTWVLVIIAFVLGIFFHRNIITI